MKSKIYSQMLRPYGFIFTKKAVDSNVTLALSVSFSTFAMLTEYIQAAMHSAAYKLLEDGTFFGEIPGLQGVWANETTLEHCRDELQSVLEDWLLLGIRMGHTIPIVNGIDLNISVEEVA